MICPTCGNENPDGSVVCTVCNSALVSTPTMSYSQPSYSAPAKKSNGGLIAAIAIIAVLAIVAILGFTTLGWKYNGTYELDSISSMGMTFTMDEVKEIMGDTMSAELKVSFGTYKVSGDVFGSSGSEKGKIKFKGSKFTIDDDMSGYMDGDKLIIEQDGSQLIFKKK